MANHAIEKSLIRKNNFTGVQIAKLLTIILNHNIKCN